MGKYSSNYFPSIYSKEPAKENASVKWRNKQEYSRYDIQETERNKRNALPSENKGSLRTAEIKPGAGKLTRRKGIQTGISNKWELTD